MIEWITSRRGVKVPLSQGVALCSTVDPITEAEKWVKANETLCVGVEKIFVLGLGAGYHILKLASQYGDKQIYVVESEEDLILSFTDIEIPKNVTIFRAGDFYEAASAGADFTKGKLVVLRHAASFRLECETYTLIEAQLLGRLAKQIDLQLKFRPELNEIMKQVALEKTDALISVKDVANTIQRKGAPYSDAERIWLALREIVV